MTIATYFEITDSSRSHFESSDTKLAWYEAMGQFSVGENGLNTIEIDENIGSFEEGISQLAKPLSQLFHGDFHTMLDTPDPNVSFLGKALVLEIADNLDQSDDDFLNAIAKDELPPNGYAWLVIALRAFFRGIAENGNAVVFLWE